MARYIENLNSCTDPTSGDYLWIVDASAGATDKDRKVDVGLFARLAAANTFTANVALAGGQREITLSDTDAGTSYGQRIIIGRNTNASTPAAGFVIFYDKSGDPWRIWPDDTGVLRIGNANPTSALDTSGTVVGAQTSSLDSKNVLKGVTSIDDVLAAVQRGAEAVRRFTYKSGAFNGEEFEGVVVDYQPRYGMDKDEDHEAGKSLNMVNAIGDLLRAVDWLVKREQARA